jgi:hypothetical protein
MCFSIKTSGTYGNTGFINEAKTKDKTNDNIVNLNAGNKDLLADLDGAMKSGNQGKIFLTHVEKGKGTVTEMIDITKPENLKQIKAMINELKTNVDNPNFKLAPVSFEPANADVKPNANSTSTSPKPKDFIDMKVNDFEKKASTDAKGGKDEQFKTLYEFPQNSITYNKATGEITGVDCVKQGETKVGQDGKLLTSKTEPQGVFSGKMSDLIVNDFSRYASPPLSKMYSNDEAGAKKFMESLKGIPGNKDNPNITEKNALELLSYIHTGAGTDGKTDVKELQQLLNGLTGKTGGNISDKNNPPGGDDKYGFATTLQVRSLSASISPPVSTQEVKSWLSSFDSSSSMAPKIAEYSNVIKNPAVFNPNATYTITKSQDDDEAANKANINKLRVGAPNMSAAEATKQMANTGNFAYHNGQMDESQVTQLLTNLQNSPPLPPDKQPGGLMIGTDAYDKRPANLSKLVDEAKAKGYSVIAVSALTGEDIKSPNRIITIDLNDPKAVDAFINCKGNWDTLGNDKYLQSKSAVKAL